MTNPLEDPVAAEFAIAAKKDEIVKTAMP